MKVNIIFILFTLLFQSALAAPINMGPIGATYPSFMLIRSLRSVDQKLKNQQFNAIENELDLAHRKQILTFGKRALDWVKIINSNRPPANSIQLASHDNSPGMPFDHPLLMNTNLLWERYNKIIATKSSTIEILLDGNIDLPASIYISDDEFIKIIRPISSLLSHTIRWSEQLNSLDWYSANKMYDVRGFLYFNTQNNLPEILKNYSNSNSTLQNELKWNLINLCQSSELSKPDCENEFNSKLKYNDLFSMYQNHLKDAQSFYNLFFRVSNPRKDITLNKETMTLTSSIEKSDPLVQNWLTENIESEWKNNNFKLILNFIDANSSASLPRLEFKPGVTANVNEVGGNIITLDANYSMSDYSSRWTIRHEYGHVLGIVDCYLEFYDFEINAMVYYEMDINNIMCSRHGSFNQLLADKLIHAYGE
jgi:hypothetical protein